MRRFWTCKSTLVIASWQWVRADSGGRGGTTFAGSVVTNYNSSLSYTATDVFLTLNGVALGNTSGLN